ncbi:MAG: glycine cleavage system protein GcvH [bacterium]
MIPEGLGYTKDHEWVRVEGAELVVGITFHAQQLLGDLTFVELPKVGKTLQTHDPLSVVESTKAASDIFAPLAGTVAAVNAALSNDPGAINRDPYGDGWICRLKDWDRQGLPLLLTSVQYSQLLASA